MFQTPQIVSRERIQMRYQRVCKKCDEIFISETKYRTICDNCKETHSQAVNRGKKSRIGGADFERRVREDLVNKGWIVDKFGLNVDLDENKLIQAKNKWAGPGRPMMMGAGFCDFVCFRRKTGQEILEMMKNE